MLKFFLSTGCGEGGVGRGPEVHGGRDGDDGRGGEGGQPAQAGVEGGGRKGGRKGGGRGGRTSCGLNCMAACAVPLHYSETLFAFETVE